MLVRLHPLAKLTVAFLWIAASLAIFNPLFQITLIGLVLVILLAEPLRTRTVLVLLVPFSLFGLGLFNTVLLFRQESQFAGEIAGVALVDSPRLAAALTVFARVVATGLVSAAFALTTEAGPLVRALMAHWRFPVRMGYALFAAFQMVPDLARETQTMRMARAMRRGRSPPRFITPREMITLMVPLLAFAIRRASRAAIAMEARGLGATGPRTLIDVPRWHRRDSVFIVASTVVLAGLIALPFAPIFPG